jgi:glycosyltransferase involved in cell wall biosynthesis
VEFAGLVPPTEVPHHLAWADIFLLPSESEGRPNAVLEAMAAELPIVASDIPGIRELLHPDAGVLHDVGDWSSLARMIDVLSEDSANGLALGRTARRRIEEAGLSWTATAGRYAAIYRELTHVREGRACAG